MKKKPIPMKGGKVTGADPSVKGRLTSNLRRGGEDLRRGMHKGREGGDS